MEVFKHYFNVKDEVEVFFVMKGKGGGEIGGWVRASILEVYGSGCDESYEYEYEVETRTALEINRMRLRVTASQIRPPPPPPPPSPDQENDRNIFEEGQLVDILLYDDLWLPGKVWEVHHVDHHRHNVTAAARTNKTIFYSLQYLGHRFRTFGKNLTTVHGSKLRIHWPWVDGKWVPPPPPPPLSPRQPLHYNNSNQCCVVTNDKTGDSSFAVACYSPQQQRCKGLGESSHPRLRIGDDVEVPIHSINWQWMRGKIRDIQGDDQIEVRHYIWSWVTNSSKEVTICYDVSKVRPSPPKGQEEDEDIMFYLHQEVEVFQEYSPFGKGSWFTGEVLEVYIDNDVPYYCILIPEQGIISVCKIDLRLRQQWTSGNWIRPQPLSTSYVEQQPLKRRKPLDTLSVGDKVEVYSFWKKGWVSSTIKKLVENQIEVYYGKANRRLIIDASRVRRCAENNNNQIFKEYEAVEVQKGDVWSKAEIWEVHGRGKNQFYTIKEIDYWDYSCFRTVSNSLLRARQKLVKDEWTNSSFMECFPLKIEMVNDDDAADDGIKDKTRSHIGRLTSDWKSKDVQVYKAGDEVEVFTDDMGGDWQPGTIVELLGNEIEVEEKDRGKKKMKHNSWMIRPKPQVMDEERNQIFQLHDDVEVFNENYGIWYEGYILEVQLVIDKAEKGFIYYVSHPRIGCSLVCKKEHIRVHRNRRWIQSDSWVHPQQQHQLSKETKIDERYHLEVRAVEVYSFEHYGWLKGSISKLCQNHVEVQSLQTNLMNEIKCHITKILHVDASRIRPPPPPLQVEINTGDLIELYDDCSQVWKKGEIRGILLRQEDIIYSTYSSDQSEKFLKSVSKSKIRARQKYVNGNWVPHSSCRKSLIPTIGISSDAIMDVDVSSAIKHKKAARTKPKDITRQHCTTFEHPKIKNKECFRCNYCKHEYHGGGINRMKQHLGHQEKGDATPCPLVPPEVKIQIQKNISPKKACTRISVENDSKNGDAIQRGGEDSIHVVKEGNMSCSSTMASNLKISPLDALNNALNTTTGTPNFSSDQACPSKLSTPMVVEQRIEVQAYNQNQSSESKSACGDIFRSCSLKNKETRSFCIAQMCEVVQQIQATNYEDISEAMINEWDVICTDHKNVKIDNDWLISSVKALRDCFKEKKEKEKIVKKNIENEIKRDMDVASDKIDSICKLYGDIFKKCFIASKDLRRHLEDQMCTVVQQIQATTYDNISEAKITEWEVICSDHKNVNIDNEWLRNSVKELKHCLLEKMANQTYVKEKIKNEKRQIELKWRKLTNEDGNILLKEMIEMQDSECFKQQEAQHTPHDNIMIETPDSVHIGAFFATQEELSTLQDRKWIASPVVNVFGQMLILNQINLYGCVSRHYFSTHVGRKIIEGTCIEKTIEDLKPYYAYKNLGYRLIECDLLFIPICPDNHWFLYVIDLKKRLLHLLDSIKSQETDRSRQITQKIIETWEELLTILNDGNGLSIKWEVNRPQVPSQQNMDDCGVYMLKFMECWKEGWSEEDYSEEKIREFRKQIKNDLLKFQEKKVKKN